MLQLVNEFTHELSPARPVELQDADQFEIDCLAGNIWITQIGDVCDTVVEAGQSVVLDRPGPALISALGGSARVRATLRHPRLAAAA